MIHLKCLDEESWRISKLPILTQLTALRFSMAGFVSEKCVRFAVLLEFDPMFKVYLAIF